MPRAFLPPQEEQAVSSLLELTTKASMMNAGGMRPGIILLREGTDTSQVRRCSFFAIASFASFIDFLI